MKERGKVKEERGRVKERARVEERRHQGLKSISQAVSHALPQSVPIYPSSPRPPCLLSITIMSTSLTCHCPAIYPVLPATGPRRPLPQTALLQRLPFPLPDAISAPSERRGPTPRLPELPDHKAGLSFSQTAHTTV